MSLKQNDQWVEAAWEHLESAIEEGNYQLALDVIEDTFDKGFTQASRLMRENLRAKPLEHFLIKGIDL